MAHSSTKRILSLVLLLAVLVFRGLPLAAQMTLTREEYDALLRIKKEYLQTKEEIQTVETSIQNLQDSLSLFVSYYESMLDAFASDSVKMSKLEKQLLDVNEQMSPFLRNKAKIERYRQNVKDMELEKEKAEKQTAAVVDQTADSKKKHNEKMERYKSAEETMADAYIKKYQKFLDAPFSKMSISDLQEGIQDCGKIEKSRDLARKLENQLTYKRIYDESTEMLSKPYSFTDHQRVQNQLNIYKSTASVSQQEEIDQALSALSGYQLQAKKLQTLLSKIDNDRFVTKYREAAKKDQTLVLDFVQDIIKENASDIEIFSNNEYLKGLYEQYLKDINENPFNVNTEVQLIIRSFVTE